MPASGLEPMTIGSPADGLTGIPTIPLTDTPGKGYPTLTVPVSDLPLSW